MAYKSPAVTRWIKEIFIKPFASPNCMSTNWDSENHRLVHSFAEIDKSVNSLQTKPGTNSSQLALKPQKRTKQRFRGQLGGPAEPQPMLKRLDSSRLLKLDGIFRINKEHRTTLFFLYARHVSSLLSIGFDRSLVKHCGTFRLAMGALTCI